MGRFETTTELPLASASRQDFADLVEKALPTAELCDGFQFGVAPTLQVDTNNRLAVHASVPRWVKYRVRHSDLTTAANNHTQFLFSLGSWGIVHATFMKLVTPFTGGGATDCDMNVGTVGLQTRYLPATNVFTDLSPAVQNYLQVASVGAQAVAGSSVNAYFFVAGAQAVDLTAGEVEIYFLYSVVA